MTAAAVRTVEMRKLTPVLMVQSIEPCLDFWTVRLGFAKVAEVPHGDALGFIILAKDGVEVMYQTFASVRDDAPGVLGDGAEPAAPSVGLYIDVSDLDAVERALSDVPKVVPRRTTFYGAEEIGVREPAGGHVVMFARQTATPA